ncbi:MAG: 50S ribosomal protein L30 [Bacteroidetes bacterium GWE2_29_8]|nr:MAG: 50S ribosomal protein L30 [Bacteroidetes bacterium GWE2_29_8]OFY21205.1 MAG: 50S ribosomal protein L30 [Bacteroidetes bacterium GWF2_29_10]
MKKVVVKQVRSSIGRPERQKRTLIALGLTRIGKKNELIATPQIVGMINKVKHLIEVEEIN